MFEELGFEISKYQKDHTIEYLKREEDDFFETAVVSSIIFNKRLKKIKLHGIIDIKDLQAINNQVKELGWNK